MTTNISGSATIYAFPARGRFAVGDQHVGDQHVGGRQKGAEQAANAPLPRGVAIASGSGWYHDEAIQQEIRAEPRRKN
jgi:Protein of unknown function (DUF2735)